MERMSGQPGGRRRVSAGLFSPAARHAFLLLLAVSIASCTSSNTSVTAPTTQRCGVTVTNSVETVPASGGTGSLTVSATRDCTWAASNTAQWIVMTSATSGQGDGSIAYRVAANNAPATRRASIEVNTASAAILQEAAECRFTVTPAAPAVAAAGGNVAIQVQANAACPWTAATDAGWVRINAGASGQGDGAVTLGVDANSGAARSAHIIVAGTDVTLEQASGLAAPPPAPGCSYTIQPGGQTMAAAGGPGIIDVTATAGTCSWTAVSNAGWVSITGGAAAAGNGRVTFDVAANAGASRTGTISVAGQSFTLTQAGVSCSYSINPSSDAMPAAGGTSTIAVTTGGSCAWTSATNAPWITIASGGTGTGPGTVKLNVAANSGTARTGTATIAAQTFTVTQAAAPCGFALSPATVDVPAAGGEGRTNVSAGDGCAWTAASNATWITIAAGSSSGTGNRVVVFNADPNSGAARSGTITIGGQTLTVTQQAAPCTFSISPPAQTFAAGGGPGAVAVTAGANCGWTAVSNNTDWLTITGGASGTGNGSVAFAVAVNAGPQRIGTLSVAGQTFTVTQDAPCTFSITPSQTIGAAGGSGSVSITTGGSCAWTAVSSNPEWLSITGGSSGTGSGQVMFAAAGNATGADRTGTITIAGQSFVLTQTAQ
jgi:Putative binding domain, N-terminal/Viral BACON domain